LRVIKMKSGEARQPAAAGRFYPGSAEELKKQIKMCFLSELGPGAIQSEKKGKNVYGAVCPHAGYQFSGACAAWAYKEIAESEIPDTYVVIGLSHEGFGSCVSLQDWKTPLGIAENDAEFGKLLETMGIPADEYAHSAEHSIEVQIPFLQFICKKPRIMPVIAGRDIPYWQIADSIVKSAKKLGRKIMIIASSDFTHYGPAYGYVPFKNDVKKSMHSLDSRAIKFIEKSDAKRFIEYAEKTGATICGQMPIAALASAMAPRKGKLMKYYTSGDIIGDYSNAVGYASVIFRQ